MKKTKNDIIVELVNGFFKTRDVQGKFMKGMTEGTYNQIKFNAQKRFETER